MENLINECIRNENNRSWKLKTCHKSSTSSQTHEQSDSCRWRGRQLPSTGGHVSHQGDGGDAALSKIHNTICH